MRVQASLTGASPAGVDRTRQLRGLLICLALAAASSSRAATADVTKLSLEQLQQVTIIGPSKYEQKQSEVAAAVSVITRQEIKAFGWRTLGEDAEAARAEIPVLAIVRRMHAGQADQGCPRSRPCTGVLIARPTPTSATTTTALPRSPTMH